MTSSEWQYRARRLFSPLLWPAATLASIVIIWQLAKNADLLPITVASPLSVWDTFLTSWGDLAYHTGATLSAAVTGYVCAAFIAAGFAAIAVSWTAFNRPVFTLGIFLDSVPLIAVAPILMLWLGNGFTLHVTVAGMASFFPLLVGMIQGFKSADRNFQELFHVLSATPWQKLTRLALPSALPYIFSALKIAAPLALLGTLVAEWMGSDRGLGTLITYALFSFNVPLVWLSILAVCSLTAASYGLVALAERALVFRGTAIGANGHGG